MTHLTPRRGLAALVLALTLGAPMVANAALPSGIPASGTLSYDVIRKGDKIGTETIRFHPNGDALSVELSTDISVKLPVVHVEAYRFHQKSTESWKGESLVSIASKTDDNGKPHDMSMAGNGLLPASLWNPAIVRASSVMNTIDGHAMKLSVQKLGDDMVSVGGRPQHATHYRLEGELARDLWYGPDGELVRVTLKGGDGSDVEYDLR